MKITHKYLVIPSEMADAHWYEQFCLDIVKIQEKIPPRVIAKMTKDNAEKLKSNAMIKLVELSLDPLTTEEISEKIIALYKENNPLAEKAADSLLNLAITLNL